LSAFRNVHHKGSKIFDLLSCVSTSKENPNTGRHKKKTVITKNETLFKIYLD